VFHAILPPYARDHLAYYYPDHDDRSAVLHGVYAVQTISIKP